MTSWKGWELTDNLVRFGIEQDGTIIGKDEEVAIGGEVDERIQIVLIPITGFLEEVKEVGLGIGVSFSWNVLITKSFATTNDDESTIR